MAALFDDLTAERQYQDINSSGEHHPPIDVVDGRRERPRGVRRLLRYSFGPHGALLDFSACRAFYQTSISYIRPSLLKNPKPHRPFEQVNWYR